MSRTKKIILLLLPLIAAMFLGWWIYNNKIKNPKYVWAEVRRGNIAQEVSVTGKTKPVKSVDLAFEKGGKVSAVYAQVGDRVSAGSSLAALDTGELLAQLKQAEAGMDAQAAKLEDLKKGARPEDIAVSEAQVSSAEVSLAEARKNVTDKIQEAYTKADDAVRNYTDQFFSNPRTPNVHLNLSVGDSQLKNDAEAKRALVESGLTSWKLSMDARAGSSFLDSDAVLAEKNLEEVKSFMNKMADVVNGLSANSSLSQTTVDGYRSDVSTARTNVNAAIANLSAAEEKLKSAQSALALAKNQLGLKKSGASADQIAVQEAQVKQAEANVELIQTQLSKTVLRSPINGVVIRQDAKTGEIAPANTALVAIISQNNLEIEANIPEVDIGKISLGNKVKIALDAFPGEEFSGRVAYVDPAETILDGVVNFKIKIAFDAEDARIRSGLTANLNIQTIAKTNALILPQYAIVENDQGKFIKKVSGKTVEEIRVTTGLRGRDGMVEILSGVKEGERVLNVGVKNKP